jgi:hypothetical protein
VAREDAAREAKELAEKEKKEAAEARREESNAASEKQRAREEEMDAKDRERYLFASRQKRAFLFCISQQTYIDSQEARRGARRSTNA